MEDTGQDAARGIAKEANRSYRREWLNMGYTDPDIQPGVTVRVTYGQDYYIEHGTPATVIGVDREHGRVLIRIPAWIDMGDVERVPEDEL